MYGSSCSYNPYNRIGFSAYINPLEPTMVPQTAARVYRTNANKKHNANADTLTLQDKSGDNKKSFKEKIKSVLSNDAVKTGLIIAGTAIVGYKCRHCAEKVVTNVKNRNAAFRASHQNFSIKGVGRAIGGIFKSIGSIFKKTS